LDINIDLDMVKSKKALLTPRLKQAVNIIKMNSLSLFIYVNKQIETNPVLEFSRDNRCWYGDMDRAIVQRLSLKKYLLCQLKEARRDKVQKKITRYLLENTSRSQKLENLEHGSVSAVSKLTGIEEEKVGEIYRLVKTFESTTDDRSVKRYKAGYIVNDAAVENIMGVLAVQVNEEAIPSVRINDFYSSIIEENIEEDAREYIYNKLENAKWLIKCIDKRKDLLKTVACYVLNKQPLFFQKGRNHIQYLNTCIASEELGINECLLEYIISDKFLKCRWGIIELKEFFIKPCI